jgi:hypothetical protein
VLEGAHDPVVRIVVHGVERHRVLVFLSLGGRDARAQQTADFR